MISKRVRNVRISTGGEITLGERIALTGAAVWVLWTLYRLVTGGFSA